MAVDAFISFISSTSDPVFLKKIGDYKHDHRKKIKEVDLIKTFFSLVVAAREGIH